ncbi:MAG: N-methyl-D-aspartate receptor NMDAR2C subunit [Kiritimatiellae bacterium]|nr:N-methyl-D-aspartate receptor NMDAR2C subunit [Kiritimatiellia bacterium]
MNRTDFSQWSSLCNTLDAKRGVRETYEGLVSLYEDGTRAYHNLCHVAQCLVEFDAVRDLAENPPIAELALWYHDAVYESKARDNEERSADRAATDLGAMGAPQELSAAVRDLILLTKHDCVPSGMDGKIIVDIDLSILAQPADVFDAYEFAVRSEYSWLADDEFWCGRAQFLKSLLARERIFHTPHFARTYERPARENLVRSLERIERLLQT